MRAPQNVYSLSVSRSLSRTLSLSLSPPCMQRVRTFFILMLPRPMDGVYVYNAIYCVYTSFLFALYFLNWKTFYEFKMFHRVIFERLIKYIYICAINALENKYWYLTYFYELLRKFSSCHFVFMLLFISIFVQHLRILLTKNAINDLFQWFQFVCMTGPGEWEIWANRVSRNWHWHGDCFGI